MFDETVMYSPGSYTVLSWMYVGSIAVSVQLPQMFLWEKVA